VVRATPWTADAGGPYIVELARLIPYFQMALGGKAQELSKSVVEKTLTGTSRERWLDFFADSSRQ
jgi:hypothetical protein